jgi:hypothetical protein
MQALRASSWGSNIEGHRLNESAIRWTHSRNCKLRPGKTLLHTLSRPGRVFKTLSIRVQATEPFWYLFKSPMSIRNDTVGP